MVADGIGDRVAVGSRDDGLSYDTLRSYAASAKTRVQETGATTVAVVEPNGPVVPVALFAAAWTGWISKVRVQSYKYEKGRRNPALFV